MLPLDQQESAGNNPAPTEEQLKQPDVNVQDVVNTDFMKDLVNDLGLDLNSDDFIVDQPDAAKEENKQGEEEKKDGDGDIQKKDNNGGGGAQGQ